MLPADRIAIQKRDSSACRMAMSSPVSRLQQPSTEQPELYNLAADTINLYPVPDPHSVWPHQNKPAAECQNEILEHHGQSCGHQTQDRWHLLGYAENDQQN